MFCQNCGTRNPDANRFCTRCGQLVAAPVPCAPVPVQNYAAPAGRTVNDDLKKQAVVAAYKKVAGSPLFLIAVIAFTLNMVLSLVLSLTPTMTVLDSDVEMMLYDLLREMGMSYWDINEALSSASSVSILSTVLGIIPSVITLIGLWLIYASGKSRSKRTSTAGLTTLKVFNIVMLVFLCIAAGLFLIVMAIAVVALGSEAFVPEEAIAVLVLVFLVVAAIMAFAIVLYARIISSLSKVANTVRTGEPDRRVSGFVAVILFISAAGSLFSGLLTVTVSLALTLNALLGALVYVLFGASIFVYKSAMRNLEEGTVAYAPAPQYVPQNVYHAPYNPAPVVPQPAAPVIPQPVVPAPVINEPAAPAVPEVVLQPVDPEPIAPEMEFKPVEPDVPAPQPVEPIIARPPEPVETIIARPPEPVETVIAQPAEPVETIIARPPEADSGKTTVLNPQEPNWQ